MKGARKEKEIKRSTQAASGTLCYDQGFQET